MSKSKTSTKKTSATKKHASKAAKDALAITQENLARIEAQEHVPATADTASDDRVPVSELDSKQSTKKPKRGAAKPQEPQAAKQAKQAKPAAPKKLSGLDAAARVLQESGQAMNAKDLVTAMADKGYWTSPGGKTPHATVYAAMIREIKEKGDKARFAKAERGMFIANGAAN